jgi:Glycosyl transferase family 2
VDDGWTDPRNLPPIGHRRSRGLKPRKENTGGGFLGPELAKRSRLPGTRQVLCDLATGKVACSNCTLTSNFSNYHSFMKTCTISVVMVVCNVERFLAESIQSILGQTFGDFEFVIADYGSTDDTKAIVASYAARDSRVRFREILRCGLAEARNAACRLARGQYIAIMDADDIAVPERLMWELEFMEAHPDVGVLGGAKEWIDATGRLLFTNGDPVEDHNIRSALAVRCAFCQPTVLMRTDAFTSVGGYRAAFEPAEDYDLWLRISERFKLANLDQVVLKYRLHPYQVSFRRRKQQTLSVLAAQVSASLRRNGAPDVLDMVKEITPSLLLQLGVSEARQQTAFALDCRDWICNMSIAGEHSSALAAVTETLQSPDIEHADKRPVADLWLAAAQLRWRQQRYLSSLLGIAHATVVRPAVAGRPIKGFLSRLKLAWF